MRKFKRLDLIIMGFLFPLTYYLDSLDLKGLLPSVLIIVLSLALLILGSERFVKSAKILAKKVRISDVIIGLTIVSIGTSLPEIASTAMASYNAKISGNLAYSDFALGNIYGSVLVQITAILGLVILVRPMKIHRRSVKRDGLAMLVAVVLLSFFVLHDNKLGTFESLFLVVLYIVYIGYLLRTSRKISRKEEEKEELEADDNNGSELHRSTFTYTLMVLIALGVVVFSSDFLVNSCMTFADAVGIRGGVVGLTISSVGSSLPELAVALVAVKSARGIAIGTLIGSNVTDPLLSVGIAGLVNPLSMPSEGMELFTTITVPVTIVACVVGVAFMWTKWKLERWEGTVLVIIYCVFLGLVIYFM